MTTAIHAALTSAAWDDLADWFPSDLDTLASESGGFQRRRAIRTPRDYLRIALAYGVLDLSLRSVAAWAAEQGIGELSDVAVLGRLRRGWPLLAAVLQRLLDRAVVAAPRANLPRRIRLVDATTLSAPGSEGADWRLHVSYDASRGAVDSVEVTDSRGGEHLGRFGLGKGDLCIGERRALARSRGRRLSLRDHDLCERCWRSLLDRSHGERLREASTPQVQAA